MFYYKIIFKYILKVLKYINKFKKKRKIKYLQFFFSISNMTHYINKYGINDTNLVIFFLGFHR